MYIDPNDESKECFANKWGLVSLAKKGHEVTLLCGGEGKKRVEYFWNDIRVIELPVFFGFNNTSRVLSGFVKELFEIDADFFHTHHYSSLIPELTLIIGKLRSVPTFITFHNTLIEGNYFAKFLGFSYLLFMQPFLFFYKKIFFISKYLRDRLSFFLISKRRKKVIYNQLNFKKMSFPPKKNNSKTICYIGRLTYQKGIDVLLGALYRVKKRYPQVMLTIIGDGEKNYVSDLKRLVKKLDLENNVVFTGKKFGKDKNNLLNSSRVMVVPSRDEGFGNVVVEGLYLGLPLIVSNKGALFEAAGKNCLVFNIKSEKDLANKIIRLFEDNKLVNDLSEKGKKYAVKFCQREIGSELFYEYIN